jgi:putative aldouronate transport system substrate-binding protein
MAMSIVAAGCSSSNGTDSGSSTTPSATPKANEPRIELTMFMNNSGLAHPDNVNPSDNPYIKIVEDLANVDLKLEVPVYADFAQKFNLLLSSGKLPDIVHTNMDAEAGKAARDGAFIDLKKYYDKSPIIQKVITPEMMELAKDQATGKYFRIPMAYDKSPQGQGMYTRFDLIEKYNGGKWPESVPQWIEVMRKIKAADPNNVPMANRIVGTTGIAFGGANIYGMYGAAPYGFRVQGGKVIPNVLLPEFKAATEVMRNLYTEGLLDKEFATSDGVKFFAKWDTQNVLAMWNGADQVAAGAAAAVADTKIDKKHWKLAMAPPLKTYPAELKDPKYATGFQGLPISTHGLYISSQSKEPDRAWRVIEAFAAKELYEAIFWGKEGDTYTVKDGKRVPIADKLNHADRRWVLNLALVYGFVDGQDVKQATHQQQLGDSYYKFLYDSLKPTAENAAKNGVGGGNFPGYVAPDEASKKLVESQQEITRFTIEAIMSRITMDQFSQEVKKWEEKYAKLIYEPMQQYMDKNKDYLKKVGVKMVDW